MNKSPKYIIDSRKIMVLHDYISRITAFSKINKLNIKLNKIGVKVLKMTHISVKNYAMLYEIPEEHVYAALENNHKLFLSQKDVCIIEQKRSDNSRPYKAAKAAINKNILNELCIFDYCEYRDININDVLNILKPQKNTTNNAKN